MRWFTVIVLSVVSAMAVAQEAAQPEAGPVIKPGKDLKEKPKGPEQREHEKMAAEAARWRDYAAQELERVDAELKQAPQDLAETLGRLKGLLAERIAALDQKLASYNAGEWRLTKEADKVLAQIEEKVQDASLDLDEARFITEIKMRAKEHGATETVESLLKEAKDNFTALREVRTQMRQLQKNEQKLRRKQEIIRKRLELAILEGEVSSMEEEAQPKTE